MFNHYRRLIELRHSDDVVVDGDFTMLLPDDPHVYAFTRRLDDRELLVLGNFTGERQAVDVAEEWAGATLLLGNYADAGRPPRTPRCRRCDRGKPASTDALPEK